MKQIWSFMCPITRKCCQYSSCKLNGTLSKLLSYHVKVFNHSEHYVQFVVSIKELSSKSQSNCLILESTKPFPGSVKIGQQSSSSCSPHFDILRPNNWSTQLCHCKAWHTEKWPQCHRMSAAGCESNTDKLEESKKGIEVNILRNASVASWRKKRCKTEGLTCKS